MNYSVSDCDVMNYLVSDCDVMSVTVNQINAKIKL
jgi:hypothetical protein